MAGIPNPIGGIAQVLNTPVDVSSVLGDPAGNLRQQQAGAAERQRQQAQASLAARLAAMPPVANSSIGRRSGSRRTRRSGPRIRKPRIRSAGVGRVRIRSSRRSRKW